MRLTRLVPFLLVLLGACAPTSRSIVPAAAPAPGIVASTADGAPRYNLRPLPMRDSVRVAIERGTRTAAGAPGPRYWQQRVRYRIQAELDPATQVLRGREAIVYHTRSPHALPTIVLNLYQNIFTETARRNRVAPNTGGVNLRRVAVQGTELRALPAQQLNVLSPAAASPAGYGVAGTLGRIVLPRPLAPGDSTVLEIEWDHRIPPVGAFRGAWEDALGGRVLQVAQWYPQVAVYDDVDGWDATPYLGDGEFYLEYGDFDVSLTLPAGHLVGATGTLQNPEQVLTPAARQRVDAALRTDSVVSVVTEADLRGRTATQGGVGGRVTWRFTAKDVRDFAFATSDRYVWDATRATVGADGATRTVQVHSLYRPGAPGWERAARYGQHSTEFFSRRLIPYLYPQITISEGPIYGMEYPMLVFIARPAKAEDLHSVIAHEIGHEWFPMMIGQDEASFAWMDEGLTTYHEDLARADFFPGSQAADETRAGYLRVAGGESEVPLMRHTDLVSPYGARGVAAYAKPAVALRALEAVLGRATFERAMRTYAQEWLLKHPQPADFFNTFERVSGRDLDWFFYPWWYETGTMDQAIAAVAPEHGGVRVTVRDLGDNPMPTTVAVTTAGGTVTEAQIPIESWLAGNARTATVTVPAGSTVTRVELDPRRAFPDIDRSNDVWTPGQ